MLRLLLSLHIYFSPIVCSVLLFFIEVCLDDVCAELIFHDLHELLIGCFLDDGVAENKRFDPADESVFPQFLEDRLQE